MSSVQFTFCFNFDLNYCSSTIVTVSELYDHPILTMDHAVQRSIKTLTDLMIDDWISLLTDTEVGQCTKFVKLRSVNN